MSVSISCSTKRASSVPYGSEDESVQKSKDPLLLPPVIESQDLASESITKLSKIEMLKRSPVAVWIDAAGFDAMEALGFLQTLDKAGIQPSLLVGTGFGCWVALSWSIDGSANRAEWQSFKWSDWNMISKKSIFNRIRRKSGLEDFSQEVSKIFPSQKVSTLKTPVDCIQIQEKDGLYFYKSSSKETVEEAIWKQLLIQPLVDMEQIQSEQQEQKIYSGYEFNWPDAAAMRFAAMEVGESQSSYTWIVIRGFRGGKRLSGLQTKFRSEKAKETMSEMMSRGLLYLQSSSYPYTAENIKDPTKRRVYLLRGRKEGEKFMNRLLREDLEDGAGR